MQVFRGLPSSILKILDFLHTLLTTAQRKDSLLFRGSSSKPLHSQMPHSSPVHFVVGSPRVGDLNA